MKRSGPLKRYKPLRSNKPLGWGKKRKPMKARSQKRQQDYDKYLPRREQFLKENPTCQVDGCDRASVDIHHVQKRNGARLLDESKWMALCRLCNGKAEDDPTWAFENGYKLYVNRSDATPPRPESTLAPETHTETPLKTRPPNRPAAQGTVRDTPEPASG